MPVDELNINQYIAILAGTMDAATREEFRSPERWSLKRAMIVCGMHEFPYVVGNPTGERCSGEMICENCGKTYYQHPSDWRVIGYGNVPFLNSVSTSEGKRNLEADQCAVIPFHRQRSI